MSKVKILVYRYNPKLREKSWFNEYNIPYHKFMTILEALIYIYEKYDSSLAFEYECKIGYCGKCILKCNDKIVLSCKTLLAKKINVIEPLPNIPVIRDLVVDRRKLYNENNRVKKLFVYKRFVDKVEISKLAEYVDIYREISKCIQCLACDSICPVYLKLQHSNLRPSFMLIVAKYVLNPQHIYELKHQYINIVLSFVKNCLKCGLCRKVCPMEINIPYIINKLSEKLYVK